MNRSVPSLTILAVLTLHGGCRHSPAVARLEGASTFQIIEPPPPPSRAATPAASTEPLQPTDVLVPAQPVQPLASPVYPHGALGKLQAPVLVGVQIFVDASGTVSRVGPSIRALSTGGNRSTEFLAAVEGAVAQRRLVPAEKRWMKPVKGSLGQEDFWLITRVEKTDYAFDVSFAFTVSGEVTSGQAK